MISRTSSTEAASPLVGELKSPRTRPTSPGVGPVLVVTPWYSPGFGGVAVVAQRLRRMLIEAGVDTTVLVCDQERWWSPVSPDPLTEGVWHFSVPASAFSRPGLRAIAATLIRGLPALWHLFRFSRVRGIRSLILLYPIEYAWPFLVLRYVAGLPLIASLHGNEITKCAGTPVLVRWLLRRVLSSSDAIIVCANHLAEGAQKLVPWKALAIRLIPNCVDPDHFAPAPASFRRANEPPTIVHISNFNPKKRTVDIIEAFAHEAVPSNCRLIMVGYGPDFDAAVRRTRDLGVESRVEFVGVQEDVRHYLWQADIFVLASDDEGAPLVLLEAMACGVPWVSTAWGAAAILPPGECGLTVPSRSPDQLAAALGELVKDPERREAMGHRARHRAETDFGEAQYVERHIELIRTVEQRAPIRKKRLGP